MMNQARYLMCAASLLLLMMIHAPLSAQSPVGRWKTIDDKTGKPKSIVEIYAYKDEFHGRIVELFREPGEDPDPICDLCPGDKKNQKTKGMTILWGMKAKGSGWEGGSILDPKTGDVYSCYLELVNPNKLKVRGYIGVSLLGRTQYWEKVQ
jgi:uncharacterized protein (DUF2147 family)